MILLHIRFYDALWTPCMCPWRLGRVLIWDEGIFKMLDRRLVGNETLPRSFIKSVSLLFMMHPTLPFFGSLLAEPTWPLVCSTLIKAVVHSGVNNLRLVHITFSRLPISECTAVTKPVTNCVLGHPVSKHLISSFESFRPLLKSTHNNLSSLSRLLRKINITFLLHPWRTALHAPLSFGPFVVSVPSKLRVKWEAKRHSTCFLIAPANLSARNAHKYQNTNTRRQKLIPGAFSPHTGNNNYNSESRSHHYTASLSRGRNPSAPNRELYALIKFFNQRK